MAPNNKQCSACRVTKDLSNFATDRGKIVAACNACRHAKNMKRGETLDGYFQLRYSALAQRHKKFNSGTEPITKDELIDLYREQNGICAITKLPMHATTKNKDLSASPDRIDTDKGYEKGNVRLVCSRANTMRMDLDDHDLLWWCRAIINAYD